ncbi:MAG: YggS family pyridoxal phosphate-dependent enzyme [Candidatus Nanopelagicaceae bacterium]|nr:YggS family pyridoxal phosphate-dependent enzyme [Candidatus Nanopelagicaceae bacterium]
MDRSAELSANLNKVKAELPSTVTLIVVTKTFPSSDVKLLYELGQRHFGENRDSEGAEKSEQLPDEAVWHFQGGIQSNKLKSIVKWSDYIHSLDEISHAKKISQYAQELGKTQRCFIQINLDAGEEIPGQRSGVKPQQLPEFASAISGLPALEIVGVMGVGPLNGDPNQAFANLQKTSGSLKALIPAANYISAGMSSDYKIAIEHGATHIRLGSSILGSRSPAP